jgi:hypothetical protein
VICVLLFLPGSIVLRDISLRAILAAARWLVQRGEDVRQWFVHLVRFLPLRVARLAVTLWTGLVGVLAFAPGGWRVWRHGGGQHARPWLRSRRRQGGLRLLEIAWDVLDVFGVPEVFALAWRSLTRVTPLTSEERAAAESVLGPGRLRYGDVRVAQGGVLRLIFRVNGNRAFAAFHTINLPETGRHTRDRLDIVIHELVHVYQYERAGSRYLTEALLAQREEGYGYGESAGLHYAHSHGRRYCDFNREQQAQIVQDYFVRSRCGDDCAAYEPFMGELREGRI